MKRIGVLIVLYVLFQNNGKTGKLIYSGMDQDTAENVLDGVVAEQSGSSYQFVNKKTFDATPSPPLPAPDPARAQAILDVKNSTLPPQQRINALNKILGL